MLRICWAAIFSKFAPQRSKLLAAAALPAPPRQKKCKGALPNRHYHRALRYPFKSFFSSFATSLFLSSTLQ